MFKKTVCSLMTLFLLFIVTTSTVLANDVNLPKDIIKSNPNVFMIDKGISVVNTSDFLQNIDLDFTHFHFDNDIVEVHTVVYEQWPDIVPYSSTCSVGNHTNISYGREKGSKIYHNDTKSTPTYCNMAVTYEWTCSACHTVGSEVKYSLIKCTMSSYHS